MADITFVKNTWGYSAPGADLKPANLQKIDDALDAVTHKANRGSAILNADQLASTTPTATGLLALAAAANTAVTGLKAATAGDADTVSGYGIGAEPPVITDCNVAKGGIYQYSTSCSNAPTASRGVLLAVPSATGGATQGILLASDSGILWIKYRVAGAWPTGTGVGWYKVWDSYNDGPGSGLDADTVSGYGIGTVSKTLADNYDLDTLKTNGFYFVHDPRGTDYALLGNNDCMIAVEAKNAVTGVQVAYRLIDATRWTRQWYSTSTWTAWVKMWDSNSDGNGGQPPAPKPRSASGAGNLAAFTSSANTAIDFPADGQWVALYQYFNDSTGIIAGYAVVTYGAGGTQAAGAGGVNIKSTGWYWRITE